MTRNNKTTPNTRTWVLYILVGVLFMAGVVLASGWKALHVTEARFCQTIAFVKSQSTSFEQYNDTITAKALRRTAVSVHQLAADAALDLSDPHCLKQQTETLWLLSLIHI